MRKMMLLAAVVAIAAFMLAAAPAFAQQGPPRTEINGFVFVPGACGNLAGTTLSQAEAVALLEAAGLDPEELPDAGNVCLLAQPDGNGNGDGDGRDNDRRDNDRRDNNDNDVFPVLDITQDFEQEAESGDIDQDFDVSQTGDNSNQTVGIQGVANTGNAQNQIGVVDAGDFVDFNNEDDFCEDFNNEDDFCEDFNNEDDFCEDFDGDDFCEDLEEFCDDFNDDDFCDDFFDDGNDFFFDDDNDRFFANGDNDGDVEISDSGASINVSPTNTVDSSQQVNQAAVASAPQWVWTASGWMLV
jgi:hypothetical protein